MNARMLRVATVAMVVGLVLSPLPGAGPMVLASEAQAASADGPRVTVSELTKGGFRVIGRMAIDASPTAVLATLVDFKGYERLNDDVERVTVMSKTARNAMINVKLESAPFVPSQWYIARYDWSIRPDKTTVTFRMKEGSFKTNQGRWILTDRGDGTTVVTYKAELDVDLPLAPLPLLQSGIKDAMIDWLNIVRRESVARN